MKTKKNLFLILLITCTFISCKKDEKTPEPTHFSCNIRTFYIVNEGAFMAGNSSVSYFNSISNHFEQDIYRTVNQQPLGDVALSMAFFNNKTFVVVNNSGKVEVVDKKSFALQGTITNLSSPRYILPVSETKAYVSDWVSNRVAVVDLSTFDITNSISTGQGPEEMTIAQGKLYVTNSGGFTDDSTITIIDTATDQYLSTLTVGINPNSITSDSNGKLWILCRGTTGLLWDDPSDDIGGELICLNPSTGSIELRLPFAATEHPFKLRINGAGDRLYYLSGTSGFMGEVFTFSTSDTILPTSPFINKSFYGLGVDAVTGKIFASDPADFNSRVTVFAFETNGTEFCSLKAGIAPTFFAFP